ncbi:hypothetical protein C8J57DRAFT_1252398 [Mycena rebaudengoi]|nr:hypothetical protein C8J57DRAFT_1252398 [Mycena rebaudengoi]
MPLSQWLQLNIAAVPGVHLLFLVPGMPRARGDFWGFPWYQLYLCINIQLWYLIHDIHGLRVWIAAFGLSLNLGLLRLIFAVFAVLEPHTVYSADMEAIARATELESLREIEHKPDDE